jgi:hypothetical protein
MKSTCSRSRIVPPVTWGAFLVTLLTAPGVLAQSEGEVDPFAAPTSPSDEAATAESTSDAAPSSETDAPASETDSGSEASTEADASAAGSASLGLGTKTSIEAGGTSSEAPPEATSAGAAGANAVYKPKGLWQGQWDDHNRFGIDGGMQLDVGYADYRQSIETEGPEVLHDFRGQFWVAPVMEHRFLKDKDGFLRVKAELVAWLRDEVGEYKVNVFDAFVQAGVDDIIDLQVGRVTTWRIFDLGCASAPSGVNHCPANGNGFDLFTLEDTGALKQGDTAAGEYYPFRYEVDYIWLRDVPARASLHLYPLKKFVPEDWNNLGIELTGQYGTRGRQNLDGARAAVVYDQKWIRLAGGAEYETQKNTKEEVSASDLSICEQCTWQYRKGYGASATLRPPYLVAAFNHADGFNVNKGARGDAGEEGRSEITTQSGYVELHTGHLLASAKDGPRPGIWADQRSENIRKITVGYGARRTEQLIGNGDFERHDSKALYVKYNFGFNHASIKFVGTYAEGVWLDNVRAISEEPRYLRRDGDLLAGRVRFSYYW